MFTEERLMELETSRPADACLMRAELRELVRVYRTRQSGPYFDVVFDGPPGHEAGRFVEVENSEGISIRVGEWLQRPDGYWALRIRGYPVADPIGDKLRSLPVVGVINVDNPRDPRHKEWKL